MQGGALAALCWLRLALTRGSGFKRVSIFRLVEADNLLQRERLFFAESIFNKLLICWENCILTYLSLILHAQHKRRKEAPRDQEAILLPFCSVPFSLQCTWEGRWEPEGPSVDLGVHVSQCLHPAILGVFSV